MKTRTAYFTVGVTVLLSILGFYVLRYLMPFSEPEVAKLADRHKEQLKFLLERSKLLTGLATAVFGAAGGFILKIGGRATPGMRLQVIWIFLLSGASLLLGYSSFSNVIWMLDSGFFNLYSLPVSIGFDTQFVLFVAAVGVLGHFFLTGSQLLDSETETYSNTSTAARRSSTVMEHPSPIHEGDRGKDRGEL